MVTQPSVDRNALETGDLSNTVNSTFYWDGNLAAIFEGSPLAHTNMLCEWLVFTMKDNKP